MGEERDDTDYNGKMWKLDENDKIQEYDVINGVEHQVIKTVPVDDEIKKTILDLFGDDY